ncbi:MAG: ABC transporter ATP-binding protein [Candidatus Marinimicrobia bacterium]|nr:ABC transporter ATP-binding protein [Candidatus Neomarinimicrobiota bacterium]
MSAIHLKSLCKSFGENEIIEEIDLEINDGEFLVLVGPSGCGKSTLLRMISGLETPNSGTINIDEKCVNDTSPADRDLAMVFQNYALYPHLTVFENMAFGLRMQKKSEAEIQSRVDYATDILQIRDLLERKPKALSGGQRQRVAVGRAIVRKPKAYLFDEPLSNLDAKLRSEMRIELKKLHQTLGTTMIYVTHDQIEAMTMGDRIAVMRDGVIEQLDTPTNLYNSPVNKFVASFIGSPQMNFIEGELKNGGEHLTFKTQSHEFEIPNNHGQFDEVKSWSACTLGIRPENIYDNHFAEIKNPQNTVNSKVDLVENIGSNLYLHSSLGVDRVIASVSGSSSISASDDVDLIFDMSKSHFFKS